jgi:hypothetical protein
VRLGWSVAVWEPPRTGLTLELKVHKERNVVGTLLTLCQFSKDKESSPALASLGQTHTLPDGSQWLEVALCHTARAHDTDGSDSSIDKKDVGDDDGDGEDPLGDLKGHLWLDLTGPFVEGEQVDGGEGIGCVDSTRDDDQNPQPHVGEGREAGAGPEIREVLSLSVCVAKSNLKIHTM